MSVTPVCIVDVLLGTKTDQRATSPTQAVDGFQYGLKSILANRSGYFVHYPAASGYVWAMYGMRILERRKHGDYWGTLGSLFLCYIEPKMLGEFQPTSLYK